MAYPSVMWNLRPLEQLYKYKREFVERGLQIVQERQQNVRILRETG